MSPRDLPAERSLDQVQRSSNTLAAEQVAAAAVEGTEWTVARATRDAVRLEPGQAYWAVYRVRLERPARGRKGAPEQRRMTLVARGCFVRTDWEEYGAWLRELYGADACRPLDGPGAPLLLDDEQVAWWFYPVDPHLSTLAAANDPRSVRRLLAPRYSPKSRPARIQVDVVRYLPELRAALRYRVVDRPGSPERTYFGKLFRDGQGRALSETMAQLWELGQERPELLAVAQPLTYDDELELHLEHGAPGVEISGDRTDPVFLGGALAAAGALAVMHDSALPSDETLEIDTQLIRLGEVAEQLSLVHPAAAGLLRDLLVQLRRRLARTPEEQQVFTHGDMKYDQFLAHAGRYTLVDFEDVGWGETSWDLGKWCAHAIPSMPDSWEDSDAAEQARTAFLQRYLELRPAATVTRFPLYEAVHLANRAMVLMWGQRTGWEPAAESLLTLAMDRLQAPAP